MKKAALSAVFLLIAGSIFAQNLSKTFYANDEKRRDVVTFTSKAPLETVHGTTADVIGMVETDLSDIYLTRARFEVDLATLKTGISMRDGHMRDQYLETDKYPKAIFEMTKVIAASQKAFEDQKTIDVTVEGNFTVHGVSRVISVPLKVTFFSETEDTRMRLPGDMLRIEGTWDILLSDYKIKRPQFIVLKLDDKQKIEIDVTASTGSPSVVFASDQAE